MKNLKHLRNLNKIQKTILSIYLVVSLYAAYLLTDIDAFGYHDLTQMIFTIPFFLILFGIPVTIVVWLWGNKSEKKD